MRKLLDIINIIIKSTLCAAALSCLVSCRNHNPDSDVDALAVCDSITVSQPDTITRMIKAMSISEKVGQLIIADLYDIFSDNTARADSFVVREKIGGLLVIGEWRDSTAISTRLEQLQSQATIPLLTCIDAESGINVKRGRSFFPSAYAIGRSTENPDSVAQLTGASIGDILSKIGICVNFAPVVDLATNGTAAVGRRSFGRDPMKVGSNGTAFMKGLHRNGVIACAKHFPGHGACATDSHESASIIYKDRACLDTTDLVPFKTMVENGVDMVMVGHLIAPKIDSCNVPASVSKYFVSDILRKELGFEGVIITDALQMKGAITHLRTRLRDERFPGMNPHDRAAVEAYIAGADILLMPHSPRAVIDAITAMIEDGQLPQEELDEHVRRILQLKNKAGLLK